MGGYLNLSAISVFVIVYYIRITNSQSINSTEIAITDNGTTKAEPNTTESNSKQPAFKIKPILVDNEELSYEDFLSRNPQRRELKSKNYPDPYTGQTTMNESIIAELGTGVDIIIHDLDVNLVDFVYIRPVGGNSNEKGLLYSGSPADLPIHLRIMSTNSFALQFVSSVANTKNRGFLLTYAPFGEIPVVTETPAAEFRINDLSLQFWSVHLGIPAEQQNNATWDKLREAFSEMANQYIEAHNISANASQPDYVVFQSIKTCPSSWRDSDTCVSVEFALPVPIVKIDEDDKENQYKVNATNFDYELSEGRLRQMWDLYAQETLEKYGIAIFQKENSLVLLMWIGISLAIITAFLVVLYIIWRMDELNAYRRFRNKRSDSIGPDNIAKPSVMEEQSRYYLEPPPFFDEDSNENHDHMYPTNNTTNNNNLFVITDDELYTSSKQSFSSFHQPNNRVPHNPNGVPKSALKNTQPMMPPPQYTENNRKPDIDDDVRIIINTQSSLPPRLQQQLYLPDSPEIEESNS